MSDPTIPFEGYDDLAAADVVGRLDSLSDEDVAAVKTYEAANKDRRAIADYERAVVEPEGDDDEPFVPPAGGEPLADVAEQAAADEYVHEPNADLKETK